MIQKIHSSVREQMKKVLEVTRTDLTSIRSGRANSALVENITILAYGGNQRLRVQEMATITTQDSRTILITPYDPATVSEIEKGIQEANVGLTPVVDGEVIRVSIPLLSEERRLEYLKLAKTKLEGGRIMIRQARAEGMKDLKKLLDEKNISEDEKKTGEKQVQELTDEFIAEIDHMGDKKEAELLQV